MGPHLSVRYLIYLRVGISRDRKKEGAITKQKRGRNDQINIGTNSVDENETGANGAAGRQS